MSDHLKALNLRRSNEGVRLEMAKTEGERQMRAAWLAQIDKEIAAEQQLVGVSALPDLTDDELLDALS